MEFSFQDTFFVANGMWFQELKKIKVYCGQTKGALSLVLQVRGILGGRGYSSLPNIDLSQELTMGAILVMKARRCLQLGNSNIFYLMPVS